MKKVIVTVTISMLTLLGICLPQAAAVTINGQECAPDEIVVKFAEGLSDQAVGTIVSRLGGLGFTASYGKHFSVVHIPEGLVQEFVDRFDAHPRVLYAEPNYILKASFSPNDTLYPSQWHLQQLNMEDAWDISTGEGVTVAVIDSGVNPNGIDSFGGRLLPGYNGIRNVVGNAEDFNAHGTHVAGTVGQETNNGIGVAGVAFDATIMPIKVLNRRGSGRATSVANGIMWAADNGADIINMSLGGSNSVTILESAVQYAYGRGLTVIVASGNEAGPVGFPAAYPEAIAVGSVDINKNLAYYSNFGPEQELVAPGGDTTVDIDGDGNADGVLQETFLISLGFKNFALGWGNYFFQGTSMASPHVAGVAALVLAKNPGWGPEEVRTALTATAEDLGPSGRDDSFGYGLVDPVAALEYTE